MISGGIELLIKIFKFACLKGIKFCDINNCRINFCSSRVIQRRILRDLFLLIQCTRKVLWNLFLLVGDIQDFYECFITEIRNITNENRKKRHFLWNLLLRLIIRQHFAEFIFVDHQKHPHFAGVTSAF